MRNLVGAAIVVVLFVSPALATPTLLYYNDGSANDFDETFGDVDFDVPFNEAFEPGGWLDGSADDIPPFNTNINKGFVTRQGTAGGVKGGGFRKKINVTSYSKGVILPTYGTLGDIKKAPGVGWLAAFRKLAEHLGTSVEEAREIWENEGTDLFTQGQVIKLVKYTGDPVVSVPPDDLLLSDLDPTVDLSEIILSIADDNAFAIFWEVTGTKEMSILDLLIGDLGLNTGYENLLHHFPYLAVIGDVEPADLGINALDANKIVFNGDALGGNESFTGRMSIAMADPIPEPSTASLLSLGLVAIAAARRRRTH